MSAKRRLWHVYGSVGPVEKEHPWKSNKRLSVVCQTFQQAVALFEQEYPNGSLWSVQDRGEVDVILPEGAQE